MDQTSNGTKKTQTNAHNRFTKLYQTPRVTNAPSHDLERLYRWCNMNKLRIDHSDFCMIYLRMTFLFISMSLYGIS